VHLFLGTRATVWPIVALATLALAVPAHAGPPSSAPGKANANAKGKGKSKGQRGRSQSAPHGRSQGAPHGRSQGAPHGRSRGAPHGRARGHSKPRPAAIPARTRGGDDGPSGSKTPASERKGGPDGKVTICHATGSETNPYVEITISVNALKAHRHHQHGEDLVEVPAGGCPGAKPATAVAGPTLAKPVAGLADRAATTSPVRAKTAAGVAGVEATLIPVDDHERHWSTLDDADAIVFGTPTYMAGPSAPFKAFLDATSDRWGEQRWKDKLAAGFTNSAGMNGDKLATLQALALFAMQHGMVWVGLGLPPGNHTSSGSPEDLNRWAGFLGAMAQSNADQPADIVPPVADQRTAEHLGARVALAALRWRHAHTPSERVG
jgi:multimeric flavodoxin WrbA